jgi:hypothetical protein
VKISKRNALALFCLLYSSVLILFSNTSLFRYLGVPTMSPKFADLRLITSASSCLQNQHWSLISTSCDPWQRPFNYSSLWVKIFAFLGLGNNSTNTIGMIELVLLSVSIFYWIGIFQSRITNLTQKKLFLYFIALFLFSPPVFLLAERGNVDIVIFAGVTLVYELVRREHYYFPTAILSFLGSLKLYPFFGAIAMMNYARTKLRFAFLIGVSLLALASTLGELQLISARSESDWNSISYGMSVIPLLLLRGEFAPHTRFIAAGIGFIILIIAAISLKLFFKRLNPPFIRIGSMGQFESFEIIFVSGIFLSSFVVGTSFDYRLITLLPFLLLIYVSTTSKLLGGAVFSALFFSLYFGHLTAHFGKLGLMISAMGDFSTTLFAGLALMFVVTSMTSMAMNRRLQNV